MNSNGNYKPTKGTLLLLSVPETPEEKELSDKEFCFFDTKFSVFF